MKGFWRGEERRGEERRGEERREERRGEQSRAEQSRDIGTTETTQSEIRFSEFWNVKQLYSNLDRLFSCSFINAIFPVRSHDLGLKKHEITLVN